MIAMGEEPWRIHGAGAPSLDHLRRSRLLSRSNSRRATTRLAVSHRLVTYHPVTLLRDTTEEADALFAALPPATYADCSAIRIPTPASPR